MNDEMKLTVGIPIAPLPARRSTVVREAPREVRAGDEMITTVDLVGDEGEFVEHSPRFIARLDSV